MSEQRLIDANRIIDFIDCGHLRNPLELCFSESEVVNMLEQAPTVPAEIVCRCKDCVHSQYDALLGGYWCNGKNHSGLWFCAEGKRRESEAGND